MIDDLPYADSYAATRDRHMRAQTLMDLDELGVYRLEQAYPLPRKGVHIRRAPHASRPVPPPPRLYDAVGRVLAIVALLGCVATVLVAGAGAMRVL